MNTPKFKSQQEEMLWDYLFDVNLSKYHECFDKVRKQFYNDYPNGDGSEAFRQITDNIISQTTNQFESQQDVHS